MTSFTLEQQEDGRYTVELGDGADLVVPLQMRPRSLEAELRTGRWLVLAFAVWSGPDRDAIATVLQVAKASSHQAKIAVRPFDSHDEFNRWCPSVTERFGSPVWLLLEDGNLIAERSGAQSLEELRALLEDSSATRRWAAS